jgi:hypothetical protein
MKREPHPLSRSLFSPVFWIRSEANVIQARRDSSDEAVGISAEVINEEVLHFLHLVALLDALGEHEAQLQGQEEEGFGG